MSAAVGNYAQRWHKDSAFACKFVKLDRNECARILFLAEAFDRRTRRRRKHGGALKRTGLAVLKALVCKFFNKKTGQLDPSIAAIAREANVAISTAQEALKRLEWAGIITRTKRIAREMWEGKCQLTGMWVRRIRVVQITNGYTLHVPIFNREDKPMAVDNPQFSSDTGNRQGTNNQVNNLREEAPQIKARSQDAPEGVPIAPSETTQEPLATRPPLVISPELRAKMSDPSTSRAMQRLQSGEGSQIKISDALRLNIERRSHT